MKNKVILSSDKVNDVFCKGKFPKIAEALP